MTRSTRVALALGAALGGFIAWEILTSFVAYTDDSYVRSDLIALAPQITGRVVALHVADNQNVRAGDRLLDIDPVPFQLAADQRRAAIQEAAAQVKADSDAIAAAEDAIASASATLALAEETQRRAAALNQTGDAPRARLDDANAALRDANAAVDSARAALARDRAISLMHQAALARAQAELADAEWNLGHTTMFAPGDGAITNLSVRVGDTARENAPLIGIVDAHAWRIIANFKQNYIRGFEVGATAWVWLDSQPWHFHRARIAGIARGISRQESEGKLLPYVAPTTDWIRLQRRFPVTLTLVDPPPDLTLFMGADARVVIFP